MCRRDDILGWLHEVLFADERVLAAYRALRDAGSVLAAVEITDPGAADLLHRVAAEDTDAEPDDVVDLLIMAAAQRELVEFSAQALLADDPLVYAGDTAWVKLRLEELRERASREEARDQLLAWLTQEPEERE